MQPKVEFKEQGGIATMDPSPLRRWIISKVMTVQANERRMLAKRNKAERLRLKSNMPHKVEYFHQVDDGYSHLTAQLLSTLCERYDIELQCHLVTAPAGDDNPEPALLPVLALEDAQRISTGYGLTFPVVQQLPTDDCIQLAQAILVAQIQTELTQRLSIVSEALWRNDITELDRLAKQFGKADIRETQDSLKVGNQRRKQLGHYSGAMFYYAGEWYWGVDRLYHLEQRLSELGADKAPGQPLLAPKPDILFGNKKDNSTITLEIYASLRSPYTAIAFDQAVELANKTGVKCVIKPVLPMVMRGVPATREKGLYILFDTAREARASGVPYGEVYDPIGQPARHGYALYYWAREFNKGTEFFSHFLRAAFVEGINTNRDKGLKYVVEKTGLDWQQAKPHLTDTQWQNELEKNRLNMYASGLWGVPSFRVIDSNNIPVLSVWGQDRLWLVSQTIKKLIIS